MSYCQFENTSLALDQCSNTLFNDGKDPQEVIANLSPHELRGYNNMIDTMTNMLEELGYEIIEPENKDD